MIRNFRTKVVCILFFAYSLTRLSLFAAESPISNVAESTGRVGYFESPQGWTPISFISELPHEVVVFQGLDHAYSVTKSGDPKVTSFERIGEPKCSKFGCEASFRDSPAGRIFHFFDGRGLISYEDRTGTKNIYKEKKWASIFTGITSRRSIYIDLNPQQTGWTYRSFDFNRSDTDPSLSIPSGAVVETENEFIFSFHNIDYSYRVVYQRPDKFPHPTARIEIQSDDGRTKLNENCRMGVLKVKELTYWIEHLKGISKPN